MGSVVAIRPAFRAYGFERPTSSQQTCPSRAVDSSVRGGERMRQIGFVVSKGN